MISMYDSLWKWLKENGTDSFKLTYAEIEEIAGIPIDHSVLKFKKELPEYGYRVGKISMKSETVASRKWKNNVSKCDYELSNSFQCNHTFCSSVFTSILWMLSGSGIYGYD